VDQEVHGEVAAEAAGILGRITNLLEAFLGIQATVTRMEQTIRMAASSISVFEAGRVARQRIAMMGALVN
jgi:hypothetical protein